MIAPILFAFVPGSTERPPTKNKASRANDDNDDKDDNDDNDDNDVGDDNE